MLSIHSQTMENVEEQDNSRYLFKNRIPKETVIYFTQIVIIYIVILSCIVNISLGKGDCGLWSNLLSSCLGYLLPSPTLKPKQIV